MILGHEWRTADYHFVQDGTGRPEVNRAVIFLHIENLGGPETQQETNQFELSK